MARMVVLAAAGRRIHGESVARPLDVEAATEVGVARPLRGCRPAQGSRPWVDRPGDGGGVSGKRTHVGTHETDGDRPIVFVEAQRPGDTLHDVRSTGLP